MMPPIAEQGGERDIEMRERVSMKGYLMGTKGYEAVRPSDVGGG